jgi:hypothetical protein
MCPILPGVTEMKRNAKMVAVVVMTCVVLPLAAFFEGLLM